MSASSVSLNTDVNVRYEKLAAEYGKLRAQAKVLREGVLDERANCEKLKEDNKSKDSIIRKLQSENESLIFRNEQLSKRVETLQNEAELSRAQSQRGSKKVKDNPSKDIIEQLKQMTNRVVVLEEELANKLALNEELSRKVIDMENIHIEEISDQSAKFREEITKLDKALQDALADNTKISKTRPIEPVRPLYIQQPEVKPSPDPIEQLLPKSTIDGSLFEDISDVYLQGLESSKQILQNLSNLFHLLSQRCELYPFDSSMEHLPQSISKLSSELSSKCTVINNSVDVIDDIISRGSIDWASDTKLLHSSLISFVTSCNSTMSSHLKELSREESKTLYADKKIEELNSQWCLAFTNLIESVSSFTEGLPSNNMDLVCEKMNELASNLQNVERIFSERWKIESRFPGSSRKLQCICEAIVNCLKKLSCESGKLNQKMFAIMNTNSESPVDIADDPVSSLGMEDTPMSPPELIPTSEEILISVIERQEDSESSKCLVSPTIASSKDDLLIISNLNARVAELELEREKNLVDLSLLRRKLSNLQINGTENAENPANPVSDADHVREFGKIRMLHLMDERQQAESKAMHYHKECSILIRKTRSIREANLKLENEVSDLLKIRDKLEDELASVRHGYESQLSSLSEHIAELNAREKLKEKKVQDPAPAPSRGLKSLFK